MDHALTLPRTTSAPVASATAPVPGVDAPEAALVVTALACLLHRYTAEGDLALGVEGETASRVVTVAVDGALSLGEVADRVAAALDHDPTTGFDGPAAVPDPLAVIATGGARSLAAPLRVRVGDGLEVELVRPLDDGAADQYAGHLGRLLGALEGDPAALLRDVDLLTDAERDLALRGWNDTDLPVPEGYIHELVTAHAVETPESVAVSTPSCRLTYRELDQAANQLAHHLTRLGVGHGDRVGVLLPRGSEALIGQLATFKVAAAAVLLDPDFPAERTRFMTEESGATAVLAVGADGDPIADLCPVVRLDHDDWRREPTTPVRESVTEDDLIHVAYTSGSTGVPKAVLARFGPARNTVHGMVDLVDMDRATHGTWLAAPGYGMIQVECFPVLAAGGTVHIPDGGVTASPERLQAWLLAEGVTSTLLMKPMAEKLWSLIWPDDTPLRDIRVCGERIQTWPPADLPFRLINLYGSSEATTVASCDITALGLELGVEGRSRRLPPIGRPIGNVRIFVLDEHLAPVPPGVVGELCVTGRGLSSGYLNRPEMTARKWVDNPIDPERHPVLYRSGDMARYDVTGSVELVGRRDAQIKVRGNTVNLSEIEIELAAQPGVGQAVVTAHTDAGGDVQLTAYLEPAGAGGQGEVVVRDVRAGLRTRLPSFMIPSSFLVLTLPTNRNGKVDRHALPEPPRTRPDVDSPFREPSTELESALLGVWIEALGVEGIGVLDNFFDLGGDSLRAARVAAQIGDRVGRELEVGDLFDEPTVAALATFLAETLGVERLEDPTAVEAWVARSA